MPWRADLMVYRVELSIAGAKGCAPRAGASPGVCQSARPSLVMTCKPPASSTASKRPGEILKVERPPGAENCRVTCQEVSLPARVSICCCPDDAGDTPNNSDNWSCAGLLSELMP